MKNIYRLLIFAFVFMSLTASAADTLFYRFNNYYVVPGSTNDTLYFDVEARSNTSLTYATQFGIVISFSEAVFGSSAVPISAEKLELAIPTGYNFNTLISGGGASNRFSSTLNAFSLFPPHGGSLNILFLSNITTAWQGVLRYKMVIVGSGNVGIDFYTTTMNTQQFYILTSGGTGVVYSKVVYDNDLLTFPSTPALSSLMISEVADPTDSNGDFIEIYNPEANAVDFSGASWYLTSYDGVSYDSIQLTGSIPANGTYVIGGPNFSSAYPGKTANLTAAFIESDGTDRLWLSAYSGYLDGTLIDQYDANTTAFTGKHAVRPFPSDSPNTSFVPAEWIVTAAATMDMTPGSHRATLEWDGSVGTTWRDTANWTPSYVPDVGHNANIPELASPYPYIGTGSNVACFNFFVGSATNDNLYIIKTEKLLPDQD